MKRTTLEALLLVSRSAVPVTPANIHEPRTLTERAYRDLRRDIVCGQLMPGLRLRVEHLKGTYGVGAGTLREALAWLVSDALVSVEGQRGYRVSAISIDDLRDLTETRVLLETEALRNSIRHGDSQWEERLRQVFSELTEAETGANKLDSQQWESANRRFHEVLIAGYVSPWMRHLLDILYRHGERYRYIAIRLGAIAQLRRDVHAEHESIYLAAMARQEARAALALEAHIRLTCEMLTKHASDTGAVNGPKQGKA